MRPRVKSLVAKLPVDEKTRKTALGYVVALGDVVGDNAQGDYTSARDHQRGLESDLKKAHLDLAQAQSRVNAIEEELNQAARSTDSKKLQATTVRNVTAIVEDIIDSSIRDMNVDVATSPHKSRRTTPVPKSGVQEMVSLDSPSLSVCTADDSQSKVPESAINDRDVLWFFHILMLNEWPPHAAGNPGRHRIELSYSLLMLILQLIVNGIQAS